MSRRRWRYVLALGLAVAAAAAYAAMGLAGAENTSLKNTMGPTPFVEEGGEGFNVVKVANGGPTTMNQGLLRIDIVPGVNNPTIDDPNATITNTPALTRIESQLGQILAGQTVARVVRWNAPLVDVATLLTATSSIVYKNDPNNNTGSQPSTQTTTILDGHDGIRNIDTACTAAPPTVSTGTAPTTLDPQTGQLVVTSGNAGQPCLWAVVGDAPRDPTAMCGSVLCKTDTWFASLPDVVGTLKLFIFELPQSTSLKQFKLYEFPNYPALTGSILLPLCGTGDPPAGHACEVPDTRAKFDKQGGIFTLRFHGDGRDPGYMG
jgi:hypothetical protein